MVWTLNKMTIDSLVFKNIFEINGLQQMNFRVLTKSKKIYLYKSMCYKKPVNRGFILFKVQEWWETQKSKYELVVSEFVIAEAALGHPEAAERRLAAIEGVMELQATEAVRALGQALISRNALPEKAEIDAFHVAIAAVNGIEYLLTWNCTHIANAVTRPKIEATCRALGFEPPIICTPDELMET